MNYVFSSIDLRSLQNSSELHEWIAPPRMRMRMEMEYHPHAQAGDTPQVGVGIHSL